LLWPSISLCILYARRGLPSRRDAEVAKANVVLADGTKVTIDGTAEEVAALLQRISGGAPRASCGGSKGARGRRGKSTAKKGSAKSKTKGPADYIRELVAENYFKTKRGLGDVQKKLEEGAHIYPVTHLSPALFRLVKARELRRIKDGGTWKYVNP
jgi:hypothetical protein